ncbi:MAG: pirin family protein [Rhodothalassiaceae bacterium]
MQQPLLTSTPRPVAQIVRGRAASDGAGVKLTRLIGQPDLHTADPFLMLDAFRSDNPGDYIAGFPAHPHRGFETVTYMIAGRMRHRDNQGNEGVIEPGGVQWMTAGRGIIHEEMPEQEDGLMWGFQLWVNLPAAQKRRAPGYQEVGDAAIPRDRREGATAKVITGTTGRGVTGAVTDVPTAPLYLDVHLDPDGRFEDPLPADWQALVVAYDGAVSVAATAVPNQAVAVLGAGESVSVSAGADGGKALVIAGKPLNEPVAWHGPFVMNTQQELREAIADYQAGRF